MTKTELEKENKELKELVRDLQKQNKVADTAVGSGADNVAFGIALVGPKKELGLVKIMFDIEKNCAIIDKESLVVAELGPLTAKARVALVDEILKRNKERQ